LFDSTIHALDFSHSAAIHEREEHGLDSPSRLIKQISHGDPTVKLVNEANSVNQPNPL